MKSIIVLRQINTHIIVLQNFPTFDKSLRDVTFSTRDKYNRSQNNRPSVLKTVDTFKVTGGHMGESGEINFCTNKNNACCRIPLTKLTRD